MPENNLLLEQAYGIVETTNANLFLTGKAGTGKTTFLRKLKGRLPKRMVVLAPTGIAAINAGGVTIHSFFQIAPTLFLPGEMAHEARKYGINSRKLKLIRSLELLVIDEISMVRADLLDMVDRELRRIRRTPLPFGGVQMLFIGDLHQLSPVVKEEEWGMMRNHYESPYFFSANVFRETKFVSIELTHVYRQSDEHFLSLLNKIREGDAGREVMSALNGRYIPGCRPEDSRGCIRLVTHNWQAQQINEQELRRLQGEEFTFTAQLKGNFPEYSYPADLHLTVKCGAQVMFLRNDPKKAYCNGTIGTVYSVSDRSITVRLGKEAGGTLIDVESEEWTNTRYGLDEENGEIKEIVDGTFRQYPIKLAWAITIHKSQGLTFDRVMIDASRAFAHGQTYVALSRCRSLEGIVLTSPVPESAVIIDAHVQVFDSQLRNSGIDNCSLDSMRRQYQAALLGELFGFEAEKRLAARLVALFGNHLARTYPRAFDSLSCKSQDFYAEVVGISEKFREQLHQLLLRNGGRVEEAFLQERIVKGAAYFCGKLGIIDEMVSAAQVVTDNKEVRKQLKNLLQELQEAYDFHQPLLATVSKDGFHLKAFQELRAKLSARGNASGGEKGREAAKSGKGEDKPKSAPPPSDVRNPGLYRLLQQWRYEKSRDMGVPAYTILQTKALIGIANTRPENAEELLDIPYMGKIGCEKYGKEVLAIVAAYSG